MAKPSIVIVGRLGGDPEEIADGKGLKFSVAANVGKDVTDWYNVTVWDSRQKDFIKKYFKKGSSALVTGLVTLYKGEKGQYINVEGISVQFPGVGGQGKDTPKEDVVKDDIKF